MLDLGLASTLCGLLGVTAKELWQAYRSAEEQTADELERGNLAGFEEALGNAALGPMRELVNGYYPSTALAQEGLSRYTCTTSQGTVETTLATRPDWRNLRIPLTGFHEQCNVEDRSPSYETPPMEATVYILSRLHKRRVRIWDAPMFRLLSLEIKAGQLQTTFGLDRYLNYRLTGGHLPDEVVQALIDCDFSVDRALRERDTLLSSRRRVLPDAASILKFGQRACGSGINFLTAIARPSPFNDFALIIQKRSSYVGTRPGMISVVPSGYHQPTVDPSFESRLSATVMRELYEELLGGKEVDYQTQRVLPDWYYGASEAMNWFRRHQGAYKLTLTGFGISLATGSAGFMGVLAILDEDFWNSFNWALRTNWEVSTTAPPLLSSKDRQLESLLVAPLVTDRGRYALAEGLAFIRELDPDRTHYR